MNNITITVFYNEDRKAYLTEIFSDNLPIGGGHQAPSLLEALELATNQVKNQLQDIKDGAI